MKTRLLLLNDCKHLKIIYVNCDLRNEFGSNLHNNEQAFYGSWTMTSVIPMQYSTNRELVVMLVRDKPVKLSLLLTSIAITNIDCTL